MLTGLLTLLRIEILEQAGIFRSHPLEVILFENSACFTRIETIQLNQNFSIRLSQEVKRRILKKRATGIGRDN